MLHFREIERERERETFYVCKTKVSFIKHEQNESFIKPLFCKLLHSFHFNDLHNGFTNDLHRNVFVLWCYTSNRWNKWPVVMKRAAILSQLLTNTVSYNPMLSISERVYVCVYYICLYFKINIWRVTFDCGNEPAHINLRYELFVFHHFEWFCCSPVGELCGGIFSVLSLGSEPGWDLNNKL